MADSPGLIDRLFVAIEADIAPLMRGIQAARRAVSDGVTKMSRAAKVVVSGTVGGAGTTAVAPSGGILHQDVRFQNLLRLGTAIAATRTAFDAATDAVRAFKGDTDALHSAMNKVTFGIWGAGLALGQEISGQRELAEKITRQGQQRATEQRAYNVALMAERDMSRLAEDMEADLQIGKMSGPEAEIAKIKEQLRRNLRQIDDNVGKHSETYHIAGKALEDLNARAERVREAVRRQADQAISAIERKAGPETHARESFIGQHHETLWVLKQLERNTRGEPSYYPWVLYASGMR